MERDRIADCNEPAFALLKAVASNDIDTVRNLIQRAECKRILEDIALFSHPFPLHYITLCYEAIWRDPEEWRDKERARRAKNATSQMLEFWKEYYGVNTFDDVDYQIYHDDFYCADPDETDADILGAPKSRFVALGIREIDLDLYCAVERFCFIEVEELLRLGANPRAEIFDELNDDSAPLDAWNAVDRIAGEEGYLCCETMDFVYQLFGKQTPWFMGEILFHDLLGLAAHSKMHRLLTRYKKLE